MVVRKKDLQVDTVFSIEVPEYGYILAQLRDDHCMDVFDNLRRDDSWEDVDLNTSPVLFTIIVSAHRLLGLFSSEVTNFVKINRRPRKLLSLSLSSEKREVTGLPGLRLVRHGEVYDPCNTDVLISILEPDVHADILYSYECLSMIGQPDIIRERIVNFYKTGVNWDKQKSILYPELALPPKGYKKINYDCTINK
ncbi:hypothetical protein ACE1B4_00160 [Aeromonas veronii]|uniref:hypothetical protein n=1 Tax=Aeromonas TaxID=642 RepID=UPI00111647DD|nr:MULTISPECIES: hypothetical protein [Aeromonas]USP08224.1 hypothetical protein L1S45_13630 [Aeromonas dhakensis]HDO1312531.1 hypothetical protein [Aeromonas veronii]